MSKKDLYTKHEEKYGVIFKLSFKDASKLSDDEAQELFNQGDYTGVTIDGRIQFLEDNGYDVTRENLVDGSLPANLHYQAEKATSKN